jgi:hypothetical protein
MELDNLRAAWQLLDRRLEQQCTLNLQVLREGKLELARRGLRPLWWGQLAQIIAGVSLMVLFAPFWVAHRGTPHLMAPALLMHAYGLMFVLFAARTLSLIGRIDYAAPVLHIQRRLAELRRWRTRVEWPLFGVVGCFIWIPLMLVIFSALGADVWVLHPKLVYWNVACGFACLGLLYGIVHRMRQRGGERARAVLESSRAGRSIRKVQEALDEIARFERE